MTPAARLSAAIEVLADILQRRRPAPDALKDWGLASRFAGAKDRAAVASLVYDALRRRASSAFVMGSDTPRAIMLGILALQRGLDLAAIEALASGARFAPAPMSEEERARLAAPSLEGAPDHIAADVPEWLVPSLARSFGEDLLAEAQAFATRAPLDVRVNTLKSTREDMKAALAHHAPVETPWSPLGLRFAVAEDGRGPALQVEPAFIKGCFEVQDEGSQIAALLCAASSGMQAVDLCAGAGGKTLALAAEMRNRGQIYATDVDARRLAAIHQRLERAGVRNVQLRVPRGRYDPQAPDPLDDLAEKADLVLVDAPCTGSGTWRRNPDAKWRLRPGSLAERIRDQETVLDRAARFVRPGGRIVYVTCSVLPEENDDAVSAFLRRHTGFAPVPVEEVTAAAGLAVLSRWATPGNGLLLTPRRTGTDAFYVATLRRAD